MLIATQNQVQEIMTEHKTCQQCFGRGYFTKQALTTPSVPVPSVAYYCTCEIGKILQQQHEGMKSLKPFEVQKK